jgi:hypothetical protein
MSSVIAMQVNEETQPRDPTLVQDGTIHLICGARAIE